MGDKGDASKLGASQPALVIGGVNPSGRKKRASFPPSARKLPPSAAAPTASNNNNGGGGMGGAHEGHGLSDAERAKIHGKINGAKALEASEKMRAYLENKARKQREAMERRYGVGSLSGGSKLSDGSAAAPREASSVTLGVGAEVKRAAAIAVEAGIRACTPESSAMLAQGLDEGRFDAFGGSRDLERPRGSVGGGGLAVELARDGSADAGSIPRVSPPRVAGFGTAKLARPPLSNRSSGGGTRLDARRPAPLARPPSSAGSDGSAGTTPEATPTGHKHEGVRGYPANTTPGPVMMTPSANDPLLPPGDVDSPGDFPSPAPSAAARYIGRPLGLHVTSPAAFGGMGSAESTPGLTPSEPGGMAGGAGSAGDKNVGQQNSPDVRRMRLPTLSDVEDAARAGGGSGSGYDSPDDSFPDDARYLAGGAGADRNGFKPERHREDPGSSSPRSEALRLDEEHRAAARIQAGARGHLVRARMDRELRARRLALAAREMEEVRAYDGDGEDDGGGGGHRGGGDGGMDEEAAAAAVAAAMLTRPGGGDPSIEALQMSVADAVRGTDRAGRSGGSESRLSADDTIARAADALTLSLTGSLPSSVGRTTGGGMNDDEEEDGGGGGFLDEDDGDGDGDHDAAAKAAAASDGEAAAAAKMQASARLHLARS